MITSRHHPISISGNAYVHIAIFMSLHVPAGACIPVASASPIHVPPVQRVLKHCGAHKHIYIILYARNPKQS